MFSEDESGDASGSGGEGGPAHSGLVSGGIAAVEGSDAFEVCVCAIAECNEEGCKYERETWHV